MIYSNRKELFFMKQKYFIDKQKVYDYVTQKIREGVLVSHAIQEVANTEGIPEHRIRNIFYEIKKTDVNILLD
jgi:hypothetical protein